MASNDVLFCSKKHMDLEIERMINAELYNDNKIDHQTFLEVEMGILKDIDNIKKMG